MMKAHEFTVIASGLDPEAEDFEDRFYEAGCSDATISHQKGLIILEFVREAKNFAHAIISAFQDVRAAGATVERFEPDYLVSLSDIAERCGLTRAAVTLYWQGKRGRGFPSPVARVTSESPLWDWVDVSRWMHEQINLPAEAVLEARMVREATLVMQQRKPVPADEFAKALDRIGETEVLRA
ncbi:MAG: hypothetical protein KGJ53_08545 [Alphaproteobacteria bacterium]|nr:hypothetical protein [Alphaproteobacteria bacterium]